ncbi:DUF2285 domain-containing protein [Xanthobacter wiegelii]|uniref:DUF2285 domain-containing protein n=1 Tax=Xanthobacter wiegelii TaxID=3119913 RepID=UPI00372836FE
MLISVSEFLDQVSTPEIPAMGTRRDSAEGSYIVVRGEAQEPFEVLVLPGSRPGEPLAALIPLDADTPGRVEALIRYWRAGRGKPVTTDKRMTAQQRRRLRLMMQAADGRSDGASYREIGTALFGRERIASEPWKTSALRDMVIGLVEGATALIGGGYLQLLRHRRRS